MKQKDISDQFSTQARRVDIVHVKNTLSALDQKLFDAIRDNNADVARKAFEEGADPYYAKNADGLCALEYLGTQPQQKGQDRLVRALKNGGAYLDHQNDKTGMSALHHAAKADNLMVVRALIACGADVTLLNKNGEMALNLAGKECLTTLKTARDLQAVTPSRQRRGIGYDM